MRVAVIAFIGRSPSDENGEKDERWYMYMYLTQLMATEVPK